MDCMWTRWVTIHQSYGLPRVAQDCRQFLELKGIQVKVVAKRTKRNGHVYSLRVPSSQQEQAKKWLHLFKQTM